MPTTRNSTVYAVQIAPTLRSRLVPLQLCAGILIANVRYTMLGTEAQGDFVNLLRLPMGAQIVPALSQVTTDGIATTATIDVGDDDVLGVGTAADSDRYADGLNVASAAHATFSYIACAARLTPYSLGTDPDNAIVMEFKTLVTPVLGKVLDFLIAYRLPAGH